MGSFDGTEICELVGPYILYILSTKYGGNHNGLYRNDGLACFENVCDPKVDPVRKQIPKQIELENTLLIYLGKNFN